MVLVRTENWCYPLGLIVAWWKIEHKRTTKLLQYMSRHDQSHTHRYTAIFAHEYVCIFPYMQKPPWLCVFAGMQITKHIKPLSEGFIQKDFHSLLYVCQQTEGVCQCCAIMYLCFIQTCLNSHYGSLSDSTSSNNACVFLWFIMISKAPLSI